MSNATYKQDLHDIAIAVAQNSKNYTDKVADDLRWELGTYDLSVGSDTTSAYQKVVPANSIEAKINTLGGMSYMSVNLLPNSANVTLIEDVYFNLPLPKGTYTLSLTTNPSGNCVFVAKDSNNVSLYESTYTTTPITFTINVDGAYLERCYSSISFTTDIMLNSGSTALPYEPYYSGIRDTAITSVKSVGSNLLNLTDISTTTDRGITYSIQDNLITINGTVDSGEYPQLYGNGLSIYLEKGTYTISKTEASYLYMWIGDSNVPNSIYNGYGGGTFTITESGTYKFNLIATSEVIFSNYQTNLMLNYGSTALPYKEYVGTIDTLSIPAQVQALDGYGWGINDTCYNYIDFNAKKFVKKVGRVDLGSPTWQYGSDNLFRTTLSNAKNETLNLLTNSNYIPKNNYEDVYYNDKTICINNGNIYIHDNSYSDTTAFKTAMSGVYLYYELATPVETDISAYLTTNKITVEGGGTLTAENTYGASVPSDIDYLKEVAK